MSRSKTMLIFILLIISVNLILFAKTATHDFINYDDPKYIINNPDIKEFNLNGFNTILHTTSVGNYQPVALFMYAAEIAAFGTSPTGFHVVSMILHILNSILVLLLIFRIKRDLTFAFIIALLFSLHPMQVETVGWASEQKGLFCALFFLLAFISYIRYARAGEIKYYIISTVLFVLALFTKPIAVIFPLLLILFDYYEDRITKSTLIKKIPFFALSGMLTLVTMSVQRSTGAFINVMTPWVVKNISTGFYLVTFYISKLLIPINLSSHYGYSEDPRAIIMKTVLSVIVVISIIVFLWKLKKINKDISFGALFFLICLLPILRFIPVGDMIAADRYVYLPSIGFFFTITTLVYMLRERRQRFNTVIISLSSVYILTLGTAAFIRCDVWHDSGRLWRSVLHYTPDYYYARVGLGIHYIRAKETVKARQEFGKIIGTFAGRELSVYYFGLSYALEENLDEAEKYFRTLINEFTRAKNKPNHANAHYFIAYNELKRGELENAILNFRLSLKYNPNVSKVHYNLGVAYEKTGRMEEALKHHKLANRFSPEWDMPQKAIQNLSNRINSTNK